MNGTRNHARAPEKVAPRVWNHITWESSKSHFPLVPKLKQAVIEVFGSCFNDRCIDISILMILSAILPYQMLGGAFSIAKVVKNVVNGASKSARRGVIDSLTHCTIFMKPRGCFSTNLFIFAINWNKICKIQLWVGFFLCFFSFIHLLAKRNYFKAETLK